MCYVHVAALVAEYLWRKGETGRGQVAAITFYNPHNNSC